jgi:uncharacterized protein YdiU (UPF0061 family)
MAEIELQKFPNLFEKIYQKKMFQKFGLFTENFTKNKDLNLITEFLDILEKNKLDFTNSFRILSKILRKEGEFQIQNDQYFNWQKKWLTKIEEQGEDKIKISKKMDKINPILIPRNHIIKEISDQIIYNNNYDQFNEFLKIIEKPFTEKAKYNKYYQLPQEKQKVVYTFCGT